MPRLKVCSTPGCPNLQPCPKHSRPRNAPWTNDRDHAAQGRFRKAVLTRDNHACTRCGSSDQLVAHHIRPGYEPSAGITLCHHCHRTIDANAR